MGEVTYLPGLRGRLSLTYDLIRAIRALKGAGFTQRRTSELLGVGRGAVSHLLAGDTWKGWGEEVRP